MRQQIAAGNWKMNLSLSEAESLTNSIANYQIPSDVEVILGCPFPYLHRAIELAAANNQVKIAAQNCSTQEKGAYTGETSVLMLKSIGCDAVILGHSERRQYHQEKDSAILTKVNLCISNGLTPIYCCGEPLEIREANTHVSHVKQQLEDSILKLSAEDVQKIVIAYEPVWAIGTGKTASPQQAQEMHFELRKMLAHTFGQAIADQISILYGGSVKPGNAKELFGQSDVDGGLVGGASLKSEDFTQIISSF